MTCMTPTTEVVPQNKVSLSPINSMVTTQHMLDNTQTHQVSESTPAKQMCVTLSGHHYTILGLPILHLSLSLKDPIRDNTNCSRALHNSNICRQDQPVSGELEGFILRQLGPTDCDQGIPISPHCRSSSKVSASQPTPTTRRCYRLGGGNPFFNAEAGNPTNSFLNRGVLFKHVPGAKGGDQTPVINLKHLNKFVKSEHFKMGGFDTVKTLLQKNNWMAKIDLKDAFFMIPMAPQCHHLLRFRVGKRSYQFNCLPFSLCTAPRVFTKTLKPVVEMLRSMGLRVVIYIDDMLLMASSNDSLTDHINLTLFLLENTGFVINEKKSLLEPTQEIDFLGMIINSKEMDVSLLGSKIRDIKQEAWRLLNHPNPSAQSLSHLIGKLNATTPALQMAPLFCRALQTCLK